MDMLYGLCSVDFLHVWMDIAVLEGTHLELEVLKATGCMRGHYLYRHIPLFHTGSCTDSFCLLG